MSYLEALQAVAAIVVFCAGAVGIAGAAYLVCGWAVDESWRGPGTLLLAAVALVAGVALAACGMWLGPA